MLKSLSGFVAALGLAAAMTACAETEHAKFAEGTHYQILEAPVAVADPSKVEVREFFFYGCPHCYDAEPIVADWLTTKPDNVDFVRTPVLFIKGGEPLARAFYVAEAKGLGEKIHKPLFDAIHKHREPLFTVPALATFFKKYGVSNDEFNELYSSFGVSVKTRQADSLSREYKITGVPAFAVNGKYVILRKNLKNDVETFEVIDYLVAKEQALLAK
ncbi:MAG: thiol:disulfide interchange protein DsbA/DsbL [Alcanivoracaceae bacterium]|nr:thiol:disulfide interchange protein DsbA/DsbL [Alcanivoracaceae bacterium]